MSAQWFEPAGAVLDVAAVAELLRCSPGTVEEHARKGTLPGLKFGAGWVFPSGALFQRLNELALEQSAALRAPTKPAAVAKPLQAGKPKRMPPVLPAAPRAPEGP